MIDDDRLADLFRAAAADPDAPPAAFDHADVVAASRQVTRRRRSAVLGGLAVLAVVGGGAAVALPGVDTSSDATSSAAAPAAPEAAGDAVAPGPAASVPPGLAGCIDGPDPALRAAVEQALPELAGSPPAATICGQNGERGVTLEVVDDGTAGQLDVTYLPPGVTAALVEGAVAAPTASGGTVVVSSRAAAPGAPKPFADRLGTVASALAPRL